MEIRKEADIIKRISELTGKSTSTLYDWKKHESNSKVYEALKEYALLKDKEPNLENEKQLIQELIKELDKLPKNKIKKFYHLIMAEIAELEN